MTDISNTPGVASLVLRHGTSYNSVITLTDGVTPIDISAATITAFIYDECDESILATFVVTLTDPVNGQFSLYLSPTVVAALDFDTAIFKTFIAYSATYVDPALEGTVTLIRKSEVA